MSILGGLEALLGIKPSVPPSAPPVPSPVPSQVSLLDKLLSERKTPASPIPTLPPAALANVLWPTGAPGGFDLRKAALAKMQEAGQLTPSEESLVITPGLSAPPKGLSGMFSRIEKAGRRKKPQEAPTSHMEAPDGGISSDELLKKLGINFEDFAKNSKVSEAARKAGVARSPEFLRIKALPRRSSDLTDRNTFPDLTEEFKKPEGTMKLRPVQSAMLYEARKCDGLFAPCGVGGGKTLSSLLLPVAMSSKRTVLLVPTQLKAKTLDQDIPALYPHWKIPTAIIRVIAYSELSNVKCAKLLEDINPDLIVADECHNLRYKTAARTKRFLRFMKEHPSCRFAGMSGSISKDSIKNYQHLIELALRKNSPVPNNWHALIEWAEALDVSEEPMAPGALLDFCTDEERSQVAHLPPLEAQPFVRAGYSRRFKESPGVVATKQSAADMSLIIQGLHPMVPAQVQVELDKLRKT